MVCAPRTSPNLRNTPKKSVLSLLSVCLYVAIMQYLPNSGRAIWGAGLMNAWSRSLLIEKGRDLAALASGRADAAEVAT